MSDQSNIALVLEGTLWGVPVKLQLIRTPEIDHGGLEVRYENQPLDRSQEVSELLDNAPFELKIPKGISIDFFQKRLGKDLAKALGASLGSLDFQYSWGPDKKAKGFFVQLKLDKLLGKLPGLPEGSVSGHVFAGYVMEGSVHHFLRNQGGAWLAKEIQPGFVFGGIIEVGGHRFTLENPQPTLIPAYQSRDQKPETSNDVNVGQDIPQVLKTNGQPTWIDLGSRKAGPITLHGLGFRMHKGKVTVLVRAEMTFGGLSLALLGVGVDVTLATLMKSPKKAFAFRMQGLGLSFQTKAFSIAGFFEKTSLDKEEYAGGILFKTKAFAITGIGAYAEEEGYKSIFGYLSVDVSLGGPPSFFVLGLVACFGYNRQLLVPSIEKLNEFPLIKYAIDSSDGPSQDKTKAVAEFNQKLAPYIPPKRDHVFFGFGVKFSTYRVVTTVAMLTVAKGDDLEFNLLGISRLVLPPGSSGVVMVFVEIALRGSYSINKGILQIEGRLSNQSYVFSQSVKLTGGFAFYAWFKDQGTAKAGDFVITVGGYHPQFKPQPHYPTVPRLGFEWKVGEYLSLSGAMYLALTPVAIMAGGAFEAIFKAGGLKVEFHFNADFLISWKPFAYDARLRISIHLSYHIDTWLVNRTLSLNLNVKLHIWGPDFSGKALLEFRVCRMGFSIPMEFGSGPKKPEPLSWPDFKKGFLSCELNTKSPEKNKQSKLLSMIVRSGLIEEHGEGQTKTWVVNPKELSIAIESVIPATTIMVNGKKVGEVKPKNYCIPLVEADNVTSELTVDLEKYEDRDWKKAELSMNTKPVVKNMPRAIWNDRSKTDKNLQLSSDTSLPLTVGILLGTGKTQGRKAYKIKLDAFRLKTIKGQEAEEDRLEPTSFDQFLIMDQERYPAKNFVNSPLGELLDDKTASLTCQA